MQTKQTVKQKNTFSNHRNGFELSILTSNLSSRQKLIALILKSHMNNSTGLCNPSIKTLMAKGSMSKGTVKNCIDALMVAGFISKITGNGRGNSNSYTLNIIESDVDNRNKHKGNTQNLEPNYSYDMEVNPEDFPQVDFDYEPYYDHNTPDSAQQDTQEYEQSTDNHIMVYDEYGQVINLAKLPKDEREDYAIRLASAPPDMRRKLLEGRINFIKQLSETSHSDNENNNVDQTGSSDVLNEIVQEADLDDF
ncbi:MULTISPECIES: helix-turn-helix domain-containing protein [unclassified Marinobacterium]|uniref:helix-turn-helix domain-containing protein n=1 Tax=unclassified Marinobacterium TaxID=2644139 RepID=UPI00156801F9|nr:MULTISPECIES: helix-turn-helix domain-containing protein [unclassified Marinobacterium]NRP48252.1 hypothetical protein [Marinobacterium sp. xm-d-543]NRQ00823.1 hypothetical protein [Marinobacterium sp. xm-d-530]